LQGRIQYEIRRKLISAFSPTHLEVINESSSHSVPKDVETHFKVVLVSSQFEGDLPLQVKLPFDFYPQYLHKHFLAAPKSERNFERRAKWWRSRFVNSSQDSRTMEQFLWVCSEIASVPWW